MKLVLFSKPECHLCENLQEKLHQIESFPIELEVRDITTDEAWFAAYEYEIPVLLYQEGESSVRLPRVSPRASVQQVEKMLRQFLPADY